MKSIITWFFAIILKFGFWFRYRIHVKGLKHLDRKKAGGFLFMPNHAAVFIDPAMVALSLWPKFPIRPLVVEYMYHTPIAHTILTQLDAIPIPDFDVSINVLKKKQGEEALSLLIEALKNGENFLIYPAARTKRQAREEVGGSSGIHRILRETPEVNVILVRIAGLWGSSFSRAYTGYAPPLLGTVWEGIKTIFKNLIFFVPKRDVHITFEPLPKDFPFNGTKREQNEYLEHWYNKPDGLTEQEGEYPGDSLVRVSYSRWSEDLKEPFAKETSLEDQIDLGKVSESVKMKVYKQIAEISSHELNTIQPEMHLHQDLGFDSLDAADLAIFLKTTFGVPIAPVMELRTVKIVLGIASKQIVLEMKEDETSSDLKMWNKPIQKFRVQIPQGETIPEVFFNNCERMGDRAAVVDRTSGVVTYSTLKMRTIALSGYIKKLPGEYVGVMLPASVAAFATVLAVQMAGKTPLMINWTIGRRHLESVVEISNVKVVLSSWKFLDRLGEVDLEGIDDKMLMLEDVKNELGIVDKLKALFISKKSPQKILEALNGNTLKKDDTAVLLFTSGSESMPKGVPLSHNNILSNLRGVLDVIPLYSDDMILSILPPFHSFGFTASGVLGILGGIRVGYSPNPTDGPRVARDFDEWGATIMVGAPTFIKTLLNGATAEMIKTMRMCVTGAEAAPPELFHSLADVGKAQCICEGYGVTECSPMLTANQPTVGAKGVGQAISGVEILVVHQDTFEPLPIGERGHILAKGPNVFSGYLNPGLEEPFVTVEDQKWYKTGDLGYLDDLGRLTISGRQKRFVKIGGEMLSLQALESAILQKAEEHGWSEGVEGVQVAVCAKEVPGEKTKLYLFTVYEIDLDEANKALNNAGFSNLVRFTELVHRDIIPIMGTGKVNYRVLEDKL